MKSVQELLDSPVERAVYGTYRFLRNAWWVPSSLLQLAAAVARREAPKGFLERQGLYRAVRPLKNPLMWFHANTAGECVFCLPLIHRVVVEYNEKVLILVTVRCEDALELLQSSLPDRVLLVRAPDDVPFAVARFLDHWRPCIGVMMSAWLAPNLVVMSAQAGIPLALLDGSIPAHIFHFWHERRPLRALWHAMACCFQLIIPHSDVEVGRFRIMGATLAQMPGWCNDLSYACALSAPVACLWRPRVSQAGELEALLAGRVKWMACHVPPSEDAQLQQVHQALRSSFPKILTVYVYHGPDCAETVVADWAAAGVPAACASAMPSTLEGVEVLIVDTPWLTPLLMHVCEVVYLGSAHFPGEHNYAVLAQAAVASCAVIASAAVMAHVQLAQELNNAAMGAAEDAAHAVRTAGVDAESLMPWHNSHNAGHTPRSQAPAEQPPESPAAASERSAPATVVQSPSEPSSPVSGRGGSTSRPHASRQIVFTESSSTMSLPSAAAGIAQGDLPASIGVPVDVPTDAQASNGHDDMEEETLSTGCSTPVMGRLREDSLPDGSPHSRSLALALHGLDVNLDVSSPRAPNTLSPAHPATPPCRASPNDPSPVAAPVPFGLPLTRSPQPRRLRCFPDPQPNSSANAGSPSHSNCSTPFCHSTPTSLHVSVLHTDVSSITGPSTFPDTAAHTASPSDSSSVTPSKLSPEASLALATPSPLPCMPKPSAYGSPSCPSSPSASPLLPAPHNKRLRAPLDTAAASGTCSGPSLHSAASLGAATSPPVVASVAALEQVAFTTSLQHAPPFAEDHIRHHHLHSTESDSGAVHVASSASALTGNVTAAKDACTDAPSARSMIGSERPLSRPTTANSAAAAAPAAAAADRAFSGGVPADLPPLSLNSSPCVCGAPSDVAGPVNTLQLECAVGRDSAAAAAPRHDGSMSPVAPPTGLNSIRLGRTRGTSEAVHSATAWERGGETSSTADLWAGASPFLAARRDLSSAAGTIVAPDSETPLSSVSQNLPQQLDAALPLDALDSVSRRSRRVTVRRSLLRYCDSYLLSAMHLPQHPEGPAVMLLNQPENLLDAVSSLLREPITRQSRGYVAVQAASRLSSSLVSTIWDVLDGSVLEPALLWFEGPSGVGAAV